MMIVNLRFKGFSNYIRFKKDLIKLFERKMKWTCDRFSQFYMYIMKNFSFKICKSSIILDFMWMKEFWYGDWRWKLITKNNFNDLAYFIILCKSGIRNTPLCGYVNSPLKISPSIPNRIYVFGICVHWITDSKFTPKCSMRTLTISCFACSHFEEVEIVVSIRLLNNYSLFNKRYFIFVLWSYFWYF